MSGFAQILAKDYRGKIDEEADKYIGHIFNGAKRMQRMIEDILKYSRIGTPSADVQACDFETALSQAMENLLATIEEKGAVITHDPLPATEADQPQMILLFQNLLGNAIKFSAGTPRVHVSAVRNEREWVFSVQDNGIGIDPKQFDRLFILFQRLHTEKEYPGTGVGLAICKKIVDRHGGRIWIESEAGKGSQFFFTIPLIR
jgi:light-regulated signal transduction histidine kinase (bacteriophytochrome)